MVAYLWEDCDALRQNSPTRGGLIPTRTLVHTRSSSPMRCAEEFEWDSVTVPSSFDAAKSDMNNALYTALTDYSSPGKRFALQLLTPGLNEKLEQKVIMRSEYVATREYGIYMFRAMAIPLFVLLLLCSITTGALVSIVGMFYVEWCIRKPWSSSTYAL